MVVQNREMSIRGCGKTTFLRCFNRLNERYGNVTTTGEVKVLGKNIYNADVSYLGELRRAAGMVFSAAQSATCLHLREHRISASACTPPRARLRRGPLDELVEIRRLRRYTSGRTSRTTCTERRRSSFWSSSRRCASHACLLERMSEDTLDTRNTRCVLC